MVFDIPDSEIVATVDLPKTQDLFQSGQVDTVPVYLPDDQSNPAPTEDTDEEISGQTLKTNFLVDSDDLVNASEFVTIITQANFTQEVLESDRPVVLDVYACWCGPCRASAPIFAELSGQFDKIKFAKLNIDDELAIANEFDVSMIPTFLFFKDGKVVDRYVGSLVNQDAFLAKLQAFLQ